MIEGLWAHWREAVRAGVVDCHYVLSTLSLIERHLSGHHRINQNAQSPPMVRLSQIHVCKMEKHRRFYFSDIFKHYNISLCSHPIICSTIVSQELGNTVVVSLGKLGNLLDVNSQKEKAKTKQIRVNYATGLNRLWQKLGASPFSFKSTNHMTAKWLVFQHIQYT